MARGRRAPGMRCASGLWVRICMTMSFVSRGWCARRRRRDNTGGIAHGVRAGGAGAWAGDPALCPGVGIGVLGDVVVQMGIGARGVYVALVPLVPVTKE